MLLDLGEPVAFLRAGTRLDPYSQATVADDWANPSTVLTASCAVEPVGSTEPADVTRRGEVVARLRLYLEGVVAVDPAWRADVRGRMWQVVGEPAQWVHPATGWQAGTVVDLEAVDG